MAVAEIARLALLTGAALGGGVQAEDCNANGTSDALDLAPTLALPAGSSFTAGDQPCAVRALDFDGDRFRDVAVVSVADRRVVVLTHRGPRHLEHAAEATLGENPCVLAAGDLDGDGDTDLAAAGGVYPNPGWLQFLWNVDGAALASLPGPLEPSIPAALGAADLDGDGSLDLALADRASDAVAIAWNRGQGAFEAGPALAPGRGPLALVLQDLDGDGHVDIATANELSSTISVAWGRPQGEFEALVSLRAGRVPSHLAAGDLDGDGRDELVVAHRAARELWTLSHAERRTFAAGPVSPLEMAPVDVALADADGDGLLDFAAMWNEVGTGHPIGTDFDLRAAFQLRLGKTNGRFAQPSELVLGPHAARLEVADLDGDGAADWIATHDEVGTASVRWGQPEAPIVIPVKLDDAFAWGDLDGDAKVDVVTNGDIFWNARVYWSVADPSTARSKEINYGSRDAVHAGDLDHDGTADLVVASHPPPWEEGPPVVGLVWSQGDGTFEAGEKFERGANDLLIVDLDGDHDLDVALRSFDHGLGVLWNRGSRRFELTSDAGLDRLVRPLAFGDLDGDRRTDVLSATLQVFRREADGSYTPSVKLANEDNVADAELVDMDGDDDLDVIAGLSSTGRAHLWTNLGGGEFGAPATLSPDLKTDFRQRSLAAGDLDGDGDIDLAVSSPDTSSLAVLIHRDNADVWALERFTLDGQPSQVEIADLLGTGQLGLLVHCPGTQDLWVLNNLTRPAVSTDCNSNAVPDECDIASGAALDADSNGIPDDCGARFRRGDSNQDAAIDLSDAVHVLGFLFLGLPARHDCPASADTGGDGVVDVSDAVQLLGYLFTNGSQPAPPFPACGFAGGDHSSSCDRHAACP